MMAPVSRKKRAARALRERQQAAPPPSGGPATPSHPANPLQVLAAWAANAVLGKAARFYSVIFLGFGGVALSIAWTVGPQQALDERAYARLTARADARIVERWLAIEWKTSDSWVPDWRNVAKATPCAVLDYDGDWGSTQRAFCGTRFPFNTSYHPHRLDELAPGVPFDWARDASGLMVPELRMGAALKRHLEAKAAEPPPFPNIVDAKNAFELLQFELVSPTESAIRGWSSAPAKVVLAVDPSDPESAIPAGFIDKRGKREIHWVATVFAGAFGLALWWAGANILLPHLPLPTRVIMAALPLAALPWWGDELPKYLARLNEDFAEMVEDMLGDVDRLGRLVASAPEDALLARGERVTYKPGGPPYEQTFGRLKLAAPTRPFATPDLALAALTRTVAEQVRAWPADERAALFQKLEAEKKRSLYGAGLAFTPAAAEQVSDPRTEDAPRRAARAFLSEWVTQPVLEPYPSQPAFAQRVELFRELTKVPVPVIANPAGWIAERGDKAAQKAAAEANRR
jgi:hypothetical protein